MNTQHETTSESEPLQWKLDLPISTKFALGAAAYLLLFLIAASFYEAGVSVFTLLWLMCPLVLGGSALAFQYFRPRTLTLWNDRLEYPRRRLWRTSHDTVSLSEIDAAVDVEHYLLKYSTLIISDAQGRQYPVSEQQLSSHSDLLEFKNALMQKVEKSGNTLRVEAGNVVEEDMLQRTTKVTGALTSVGFVAVLLLVFGMQWLWQSGDTGTFGGVSEAHLLDMGGLLQSSVLEGRWDRIFTSSLLHHHFAELVAVFLLFALSGVLLEVHIGAARMTIIFLLGCLAGALVTLAIGPDEVIVGAWSGCFAAWAATLYLYLRRRSKIIIVYRSASQFLPGLFALGGYAIIFGHSYTPLPILGSLAIAGIGTGFVTVHLLLSSKSLFDPASPAEVSIATVLAVVYGIALATSLWHFHAL